MDRPLSVLIVEDDPVECALLVQCIEMREDVRLVGTTNNANTALEYARDHWPDAIILDLELHKGVGDGISFLKALDKAHSPTPPYILVTTNSVSGTTHDQTRRLGADFVMVKNQEGYSARAVIEFLRTLKDAIHDAQKKRRAGAELEAAPEAPAEQKRRAAVRAAAEIDRIGVSPKAIGRIYLIDAVLRVAGGQLRNVIPDIARAYGKSDASVERAMQNAINRAWNTADIEDLQRLYTARIRSDKGVPTLTEFIYFYANKVKTEL